MATKRLRSSNRSNPLVKWRGAEASVVLKQLSQDLTRALALQHEAYAKIKINEPFEHADGEMRGQVDTGVMMASTRAVFDGLPIGIEAAVISPQHYAAAQEAIRPFMWPSGVQARNDFGLKAKEIIKRDWPK